MFKDCEVLKLIYSTLTHIVIVDHTEMNSNEMPTVRVKQKDL